MQLFKTEMLCLHPPRPRRFYGPRGERGLRYGGRLPARRIADAAHSAHPADTKVAETDGSANQASLATRLDRAA